MSFGGADYRQAIILAVENQGTAAIDQLRASMRVVQEQIEGWNRAVEAGTTSTTTYISAVAKLNQVYGDLADAVVAARSAEGDAMRARIDALAREERAVADAAERERQAIGEAMRARVDAYARAERAAEQLAATERQAAGDAQRARIDSLVRQEQAVESLRAQLDKNAEARRREGVAEQWLDGITVRFSTTIKQLAEEERLCATAVMANTGALTEAQAHAMGFASVADANTQAQRRFAYAALNASHALQDFTQSGLGAVVNNVPLMTQSITEAVPALKSMSTVMGGPAGVAAAAMGAAVALDVISRNWSSVVDAFAGKAPKLVNDVQALKDALKGLEDKRIKTSLDYQDIHLAREELAKLTAEEAAYQRLKTGKSEEQQRRSEVVSAAITEGAGTGELGSGVDNVVRAVASATATESPRTARLKKQYNALIAQGQETAARDLMADNPVTGLGPLAASMAADRENAQRSARSLVGGAAEGREQQRAALLDIFRANPEKFTALGVDPLRFGAGLENAATPNLFEPERRKRAEEQAKKEKAAAEQAQLEQMRINDRLKATDPNLTGKSRDADLNSQIAIAEEHVRDKARDFDAARSKAEGEAVWQVQQQQRLDRERKAADAAAQRGDRRAANLDADPARQRRQAAMAYGQEFQSRAMKEGVPVSGAQATAAGKQIAGMVGDGVNVDAAMMRALANLDALLRRRNAADIRNMAAWDRMDGIVDQAAVELQFIEMQQRRAQQRRIHLNRH